MRVLHVFKTYLPDSFGGVERVIWEIAEQTAELGVQTDVLSLSRNPSSWGKPQKFGRHMAHKAKLDLNVASTGISLSVFGKFRELAREADIIQYHFPWPMMDLAHLTAIGHKPSLVTYHSDIVRQRLLRTLYRPFMSRFLGSVDRIVATSDNYVRTSPVLRQFAFKTSTIPIGIGDRIVPPDDLVDSWRQRVGEGFFLFVGELRYYKGLQFLIEAARNTSLPIVIAGSGEFGETIQAANLPNVQAVGRITDEDKEALHSLSSAFVFPSHLRSEAFGVALLEAARAGRPMISCELGTGTSYVNIDGDTGLVVPPANSEALSTAMRRLSADSALRQRMGAAALARYQTLFRSSTMAAAYHALYQELLNTAPAQSGNAGSAAP